ncbi:mucin-binding protein, partial [Streptococcus sp. zg-JUN1979]|uniref:mucin-binding protein n=1 Tax=Streptococcus sp. zg-JUN1979 TaxID=3391450 RepID=UPI0039B03C78
PREENYTVTVPYKPLGSYVPVDPDGNPIGPKTPIENDPSDPTKPSKDPYDKPTIPGYDKPSQDFTPDPENPGKDIPVPYTPSIVPVDPNDPKEPGTPIDPNNPDGPKWPDTKLYKDTSELTVHYVDENGNKVAEDKKTSVDVHRKLYINAVTGEFWSTADYSTGKAMTDAEVAAVPWVADQADYSAVTTPVVNGYVASTETVKSTGATTKADKQVDGVKVDTDNTDGAFADEATVVYKPVGSYVPVDPDGN